jgi:hypothetical protein
MSMTFLQLLTNFRQANLIKTIQTSNALLNLFNLLLFANLDLISYRLMPPPFSAEWLLSLPIFQRSSWTSPLER